MQPTEPFWFHLRQGKLEAAGTDMYRVTAPNCAVAFIGIRGADGRWLAFLRTTADGPDTATTAADFAIPAEAWEAAFELYRTHIVV